jgi:RNA-directed DNA polymerase
VQDRFIQQAVMLVLQRQWDGTFSDHSYGFRPGRSSHQAVAQAQQYIAEGYRWVVDLDLEKFFDRVNHDRLMARLSQRIGDKRVLKLKVNAQKSAVARPWERKFLGFRFTAAREPKQRIAPKAIGRFKERVRALTRRTRGVSIERMAEDLPRYLRGWLGYFGKCQTPSVLAGLEAWLRRRLRSAIWKQWKRGTVRFAELRRRGVSPDLAAQTAGSAHGPWRLANSPALAMALPNAYFDSLGIPRLTVG